MKRAITTLFLVLAIAWPAAASALDVETSKPNRNLVKQWMTWVFGSDAAPILSGVCGEQIGDVFFLTAAFNAGWAEIDCEVPAETPLLVTPAGSSRWAPTDGKTPSELREALRIDLEEVISDVQMSIDGAPVDLTDALVLTRVFMMPLEPGNFIQTVDPNVTGDKVQIAAGGWFVLIESLAPGEHVVVLSDVLSGETFQLTIHLTVV